MATLSEGTHSHKGLSRAVCGQLVSPWDGRADADVCGIVEALFASCLRRINTRKVQIQTPSRPRSRQTIAIFESGTSKLNVGRVGAHLKNTLPSQATISFNNNNHYTPVLPVLFLSGGRHLLQDVTNRVDLDSTVKITPVGDKPGYLEKQYSQDAPVSEPEKPGYNVKVESCPMIITKSRQTSIGFFRFFALLQIKKSSQRTNCPFSCYFLTLPLCGVSLDWHYTVLY